MESIIQYMVLLVILGFTYESVSWFFRLYNSFIWIRNERSIFNKYHSVKSGGRIYILIPVLAETDILEDTVNYFSSNFLDKSKNISLIIVTTEREKIVSNLTYNTIDLAKELADKYKNVKHIHYPQQNGKMSHQLNYAIKALIDTDKVDGNKDLIAVYNADSRPEKATLDWVLAKFADGEYFVFQQYGCYSGNLQQIARSSWSSVLVSGSLWQTRWAIGFEIYNALKQLKFTSENDKLKLNYPLNYCIGHGLFITRNIFEKVDGFSENTHNEDAVMGLQLSEMQELIVPVPYFDISESPDTIEMLYKQKSNWYFGPLQSYSYMLNMLKKGGYGMFRKIRLFVLSTKLFSHAIYWIFGPTLIAASIILSIANFSVGLIILSAICLFLFALPSIIAHMFMLEIGTISTSFNPINTFKSILKGFFVFYIMHGLSAYRGLYKYLRQVLNGKDAIKEKTIIKRV